MRWRYPFRRNPPPTPARGAEAARHGWCVAPSVLTFLVALNKCAESLLGVRQKFRWKRPVPFLQARPKTNEPTRMARKPHGPGCMGEFARKVSVFPACNRIHAHFI